MSDKIELPKSEIATKDWTLKELMDTERRIEKAFHEQTIYLGNRFDSQNQRFDSQNRWMIGIMVTLVATLFALVAAVYFK
ncbi:MAG: hypothetical protein ACPGRX_07545 [Bdellovibrionales bacterium]